MEALVLKRYLIGTICLMGVLGMLACESSDMLVLKCEDGPCPKPCTCADGSPCDENGGCSKPCTCADGSPCDENGGCIEENPCDECAPNQTCKDGVCVDADPCDECMSNQTCKDGVCVDADSCDECASNQTCKDGVCVDVNPCDECTSEQICENDRCVSGFDGVCEKSDDCTDGLICVENHCKECRDNEIKCVPQDEYGGERFDRKKYYKCGEDGKWDVKKDSCSNGYRCIDGICMDKSFRCGDDSTEKEITGNNGEKEVLFSGTQCGVKGVRYKCVNGYYVEEDGFNCGEGDLCVLKYVKLDDSTNAYAICSNEIVATEHGECETENHQKCSPDENKVLVCKNSKTWEVTNFTEYPWMDGDCKKQNKRCLLEREKPKQMDWYYSCQDYFKPKYVCENDEIKYTNAYHNTSATMSCKAYGRTCDPNDPVPRCTRY